MYMYMYTYNNAQSPLYGTCTVFVVAVGVNLVRKRTMEKEKVIGESDAILGRPGYGVQSPLPPYSDQEVPDERQSCRVYPGRFYVLMVLSFLALHQNVAWMTFGTIPNESYQYFGLTDDDVTIIAAYGPIAFIPLAFPFMWFLDRFGLRVSVLSASWLLAIATGIRCFVPDGTKWAFLFHIAHFMIGVVGLPVMIAPPRLSSVWFPPKQRTFATAIANTAQGIGVSLAFITIPYLTRHYDIHTMLYVQAELGLFVALLATIYFPARPPTPPSYSATTERTRFLSSMKALACNRAFVVLGLSAGLVNGGAMGFASVLSIILNPTTAGFVDKVEVRSVTEFFHSNAWLGAVTGMCGVFGGQIMGLIADRIIRKKFKLLMLLFLTLSTILAFWFALSIYGYTSNNAVNLFLTLCLQVFFTFAPSPLFYEAAVEVTYPVPEGTSAGVISILMNIAAITFQIIGLFHIFSNSHPEKARVMVWVLGGLTGLACITMLFFEENYRRLNVDIQASNKEKDKL